MRLRMICQSWKVMFQAEYSSGQPLRMLVDLRAAVEYALGNGKAPEAPGKSAGKTPVNVTAAKGDGKSVSAASGSVKPAAKAAAASAGPSKTTSAAAPVPEFEISNTPGWGPDSGDDSGTKS